MFVVPVCGKGVAMGMYIVRNLARRSSVKMGRSPKELYSYLVHLFGEVDRHP